MTITAEIPTGTREDAGEPRYVTAPDGVRLAVYETGSPNGPPILLIHGWSQSHLSWKHQFHAPELADYRLVFMDKRGHGASDKPLHKAAYLEPERWAGDVHAVMDVLGLQRPLVVAWSYGAVIVLDYLRRHGTANVSGLVFANAAFFFGGARHAEYFSPLIAECVAGMTSENLTANITATVRLMRDFCALPLSPGDYAEALAYNMVVPPIVRLAMCERIALYEDLFPTLDVDVLIAHGGRDPITLPAHGHYGAKHIPRARLELYEESGHAVFFEEPQRFNRSLARFARHVAPG